jgi:hypothetical protein
MKLDVVIDVESVGLHGEGFAVAWVIGSGVAELGPVEIGAGVAFCLAACARGPAEGLQWVRDHVTLDTAGRCPRSEVYECASPREVRNVFWTNWLTWRERGMTLWVDCGWPVEARFLAACVDEDPKAREWRGPYPLHEIATLRAIARLPDMVREGELELPLELGYGWSWASRMNERGEARVALVELVAGGQWIAFGVGRLGRLDSPTPKFRTQTDMERFQLTRLLDCQEERQDRPMTLRHRHFGGGGHGTRFVISPSRGSVGSCAYPHSSRTCSNARSFASNAL